ncbi:hypothetical protein VB713_11900 [Anabaena cylindrica UHCC 0172]|nr:hypothetical protein [Anabaena cylindrica]MEA5551673.1 hypothetical protein [Anabaena cylindrica UHCC 0172]
MFAAWEHQPRSQEKSLLNRLQALAAPKVQQRQLAVYFGHSQLV